MGNKDSSKLSNSLSSRLKGSAGWDQSSKGDNKKYKRVFFRDTRQSTLKFEGSILESGQVDLESSTAITRRGRKALQRLKGAKLTFQDINGAPKRSAIVKQRRKTTKTIERLFVKSITVHPKGTQVTGYFYRRKNKNLHVIIDFSSMDTPEKIEVDKFMLVQREGNTITRFLDFTGIDKETQELVKKEISQRTLEPSVQYQLKVLLAKHQMVSKDTDVHAEIRKLVKKGILPDFLYSLIGE